MKWIICAFSIILFTAITPARADTTDWVEVHGGAVRLITSGPLQDGQYLAGLEFLLEPGWHTYWRNPGDAGIPPQISFSDSENLKEFELLFPVPERYNDGFSESIVYHDGIVLPIRITPSKEDEDLRLALNLFFGICKDICVPGEAVLTLDLAPGDETDTLSAKLIARDLENVPQANVDHHLRIQSISLNDQNRLVIEAEVGSGQSPDLFAAGPAGSFIGLPQLTKHSGSTATWHLSPKGLTANEADDQLRLVLTAGGEAVEYLATIQRAWLSQN